MLDVVTIPLVKALPMGHQTENHVIDEHRYWVKERVATWPEVLAARDSIGGALWINGYSTYHGINDKIPEAVAKALDSSLRLLDVDDLVLDVASESGFAGRPARRRVRAIFTMIGHRYSMVVTDPAVEDEYLARENGQYELRDAILCVSLSESIHGHVHKLAAAVITKHRCGLAH